MSTATALTPVQLLERRLDLDTLEQLEQLAARGYALVSEESEFRFHLNGTAIGELLADAEEVAAAASKLASGDLPVPVVETANREEHEADMRQRLTAILDARGIKTEARSRSVICERGVFTFRCGADKHTIHEAEDDAIRARRGVLPNAQSYLLLCCVSVKDHPVIARVSNVSSIKIAEWEEDDAFPFDVDALLPPLAETLLERIATIDTLPEFQRFMREHDLQAVFEGELDAQKRFALAQTFSLQSALEACARRLGMPVASEPEDETDSPFFKTKAADSETVAHLAAKPDAPSGETSRPARSIIVPTAAEDVARQAALESGRAAFPVEELDLALVRFDGGTQMRVDGLDEKTVSEYAAAMKEGVEFDPGVVFFDGTHYWCAAGFHRSAGAQHAGKTSFPFEVREGTLEDAIFFAAASNRAHGLRMKDVDVNHAVESLLLNVERARTMPNREIARHVGGISHTTVGDIRERLTGSRTPAEVTVKRGGSTYTLNTENIGKSNSPAEVPPEALDDSHSQPEASTASATTEASQTESTAPAGDSKLEELVAALREAGANGLSRDELLERGFSHTIIEEAKQAGHADFA